MSSQDFKLATMLLDGFVDRNSRTKYLEKGSDDEKDARKALARLLRGSSPLNQQIREHLANLFDPPKWQQRKLEFVSCHQGPQTDHVRNTQIAESVRNDVRAGARIKDAVERAAERFGISEEMAIKIWGIYRPLFEQIEGALPPRRRTSS